MTSYSSSHSTPIKLQFLVLGAAGAGKTSILRRYFHKTFQAGSRVPTLGSDFYTGRVPHPKSEDNEDSSKEEGSEGEEFQICLQMWDTPGRERFASKRRRQYEASFSDSFFSHADAIVLVYDMTDSTSFTQLLKWYADLMECLPNNSKKTASPPKQLPILIVANKMDILFQSGRPDGRAPHHAPTVSQRDVFGMDSFRGKDFRYEYRVSPLVQDKNSAASLPVSSAADLSHSTAKNVRNKRMEISSYLANRENWTTDGSYLESLLNSEEGSQTDREMVLLWCMRNGLKHYEVSAATGEGVDEAMGALVLLALDSKKTSSSNTVDATTALVSHDKNSGSGETEFYKQSYQRNQKLDLHQRYAPKEDLCSCFRPVVRWFKRN